MDLTKDLDAEPPPTKKQRINDCERIIMGEELSDIEINYAQQLLKVHHPKFSGFHSTLLQGRVKGSANNIQIVHCSTRHHWITVTTMNCKLGEVKVYDSLLTYCDKETVKIIHDIYQDSAEKTDHHSMPFSKAKRRQRLQIFCNRLCCKFGVWFKSK